MDVSGQIDHVPSKLAEFGQLVRATPVKLPRRSLPRIFHPRHRSILHTSRSGFESSTLYGGPCMGSCLLLYLGGMRHGTIRSVADLGPIDLITFCAQPLENYHEAPMDRMTTQMAV